MSASAVTSIEPEPPRPSPSLAPAAWSPARRIAFRFLFSYLVLFAFEAAAGSDFDFDWLTLAPLWRLIVAWIGRHVLHHEITNLVFGPSDTVYGWVLNGLWVVAALVACVVWSMLDRRRLQYERLHGIARVFVRYYLAYAMLGYGLVKIVKLQFLAPGPARLMTTFGEASPMGLLWAFMGASTAYTVFAGIVETLGGTLLLFRRTTTLGALIVGAAMTNVVMLNFAYDVPIKLLASQLLLLAVWLVAPDARRLFDVLVLHRPTAGTLRVWTPATQRGRWARRIGKVAVAVVLVGANVRSFLPRFGVDNDGAPKPPYYGAFEVETFLRDGAAVPQVFGDAQAWRALALDRQSGVLRFGDGERTRFSLPPKNGAIELDDGGHTTTLAMATPDATHVVLRGRWKGSNVIVTLVKVPDERFVLLNRGFHWVNETQFIR
jgi:hypothetical protein